MSKSLLIVVSAPSGAGKSTFCDRLLSDRHDVRYSVSCTTRKPRGAEVDGKDYHFVTEPQFLSYIEKKEFLEYACVHGNMYGTLKRNVVDAMNDGISVLMDIDVIGARQVRTSINGNIMGDIGKDAFLDIFIMPPSIEELERRIRTRGEDAPDAILCRMKNAQKEMESVGEYGHVIVNEDLDVAYADFSGIIEVRITDVATKA